MGQETIWENKNILLARDLSMWKVKGTKPFCLNQVMKTFSCFGYKYCGEW